jgi:hypothetical protein
MILRRVFRGRQGKAEFRPAYFDEAPVEIINKAVSRLELNLTICKASRKRSDKSE